MNVQAGRLLIATTTKVAKQQLSTKNNHLLLSLQDDLTVLEKLIHKHKVAGDLPTQKVMLYEDKLHKLQQYIQKKLKK